jgi:hypothetical protein
LPPPTGVSGSGETAAERLSTLRASTLGAPNVMNDPFMTPDALKESFMTSERPGR